MKQRKRKEDYFGEERFYSTDPYFQPSIFLNLALFSIKVNSTRQIPALY